jgi:hypothetical protein
MAVNGARRILLRLTRHGKRGLVVADDGDNAVTVITEPSMVLGQLGVVQRGAF